MERKEINVVLASAGLRPQHHFGQNFMVDQQTLRAIVAAGAVGSQDVVLEVGPGVGNLTRLLSQAASRGAVLAVDIDRKLLPAAQRYHATGGGGEVPLGNVTWLLADVLAGKHAIEPQVLAALRELRAKYPGGELKLVSNLPYNAASPLIAELLVAMWREAGGEGGGSQMSEVGSQKLSRLHFSRLTFTVQWEVGMRMAAKADCRDYGPLGILIQSMADVEIVRKIPPGVFWPPPKIHSALVTVIPSAEKMARIGDAPAFQGLLAGIFSHRRQTLGNALKHYLGERWTAELKAALGGRFDLSLRPENFTVEQLLALCAAVSVARVGP